MGLKRLILYCILSKLERTMLTNLVLGEEHRLSNLRTVNKGKNCFQDDLDNGIETCQKLKLKIKD